MSLKLRSKPLLNVFWIDSDSSFLMRPVSTYTAVRFFPIALDTRTAATEESTPPERAMMAFSLPICLLSFQQILL